MQEQIWSLVRRRLSKCQFALWYGWLLCRPAQSGNNFVRPGEPADLIMNTPGQIKYLICVGEAEKAAGAAGPGLRGSAAVIQQLIK